MKLSRTKSDVSTHTSRYDVFISYSRDDDPFVRRLYGALNDRERRAWVDWEGIPPTADWMAEVFAAIESADNFVFVLSQASLASDVCSREVEHAVKCRKRLVPFVWGDIDETQVPTELRRLNWIICRNDDDFQRASGSLLQALTLNLDWVREHTRLLVRAVDWRDGGADASLLLHGSDLKEAEQWLAQGVDEEPKPTELHRDYVIASRTRETRSGRRTLSVVTAGLVFAVALAIAAFVQRQEARKQATIANEQRQEARKQATIADQRRVEAEQRRVEAERQSVAALTNESNASLSLGRELEALVASVNAGKKIQKELKLLEDSRSVYRTLIALRRAINEVHERNRIPTGHFRGVTQLAFGPDDQSLYSVGGGGDIKQWSVDGRLRSIFETEHSGLGDGCTSIQNFGVSPDGKVLATLGNEGTFALWNARGQKIREFATEAGGGGFCTGIVDSRIDFASGMVTVRDAEHETTWTFAGARIDASNATPADGQTGNETVSNADGSMVAAQEGDTISILRRNRSTAFRIPRQRTAAFSHRTGQLATVSADVDQSVIHIWDLATLSMSKPASGDGRRKAAAKTKWKLGDRNYSLDFREFDSGSRFEGVISPDGRLAAVPVGHYGERLALWQISSGPSTGPSSTRIAEFDADQIASADFAEALQSLAFSYDSQLLASGGSDGTVKLWNAKGKLVRKIVAHSQSTNVRFSPDGRLLLTWGDSRDGEVAVKLWTVEGELLDPLSNERVDDAWFSGDGKWLLATTRETAQKRAWSLDLDQLVHDGCAALRLYLANPAMAQDAKMCS